MVIGKLCGLARILGGLEIALGDRALVKSPLRALVLALGGADLHVGEVGCFLGRKLLAADLDRLALQRGVEALERRALALEFILERGAHERREHLARLDGVARAHLVADVAGRDREKRRAHGRDDRSLRRDVANERAFGHRRDAKPLARDRVLGRAPAADQEAKHEYQEQRAARDADHLLARAVGLRPRRPRPWHPCPGSKRRRRASYPARRQTSVVSGS